MKKTILFAFSILIAVSAFGGKKREADSRLQQVKTVFIRGASEEAAKAREKIEKRTCYRLALSPDKADAILEIERSVLTGAVSATMTTKNGEIIWSGDSSGNKLASPHGIEANIDLLFRRLQNDAWPGSVKAFHGPDLSICPR